MEIDRKLVCPDCWDVYHDHLDALLDYYDLPMSRIIEIQGKLLEWQESIPNGQVVSLMEDDGSTSIEFTWRPCELCGSRLGGQRETLALFSTQKGENRP